MMLFSDKHMKFIFGYTTIRDVVGGSVSTCDQPIDGRERFHSEPRLAPCSPRGGLSFAFKEPCACCPGAQTHAPAKRARAWAASPGECRQPLLILVNPPGRSLLHARIQPGPLVHVISARAPCTCSARRRVHRRSRNQAGNGARSPVFALCLAEFAESETLTCATALRNASPPFQLLVRAHCPLFGY